MKTKIFTLFIVIVSLFVACQVSTTKKQEIRRLSIHQQLQFDSTFNTIVIKNNSNYPVVFRMKLNESFPLEMSDIQSEIDNIASQQFISKAQAAWLFVGANTYWNKPYTSANWQHNPLLFLNSLGGGMCDDMATVLASIWKKTYDSVKVVGLEGHVVPEVKENGKWKMFDPDNEVAYLNQNGEICSVRELENNPQIISNPQSDKVIELNSFFKYQSPLAGFISNLYATKKNNYDATEWHMNYPQYSDTFSLPAYSSMEISNIDNHIFLKVVLRKGSTGKLKIPFIPHSANGDFVFSLNHQKDTVKNNQFLFSSASYNYQIEVLKTIKTSEIIYLINPKLNIWKANNLLSISTTNNLLFEKKKSTQNAPTLFGQSGLFFDVNTIKYADKAKLWRALDVTDAIAMEANFKRFLDEGKELTSQQKENKIAVFRKVYNQIFKGNNRQVELLSMTSPKSILFLFVAVKEDRLDYLFKINSDI